MLWLLKQIDDQVWEVSVTHTCYIARARIFFRRLSLFFPAQPLRFCFRALTLFLLPHSLRLRRLRHPTNVRVSSHSQRLCQRETSSQPPQCSEGFHEAA